MILKKNRDFIDIKGYISLIPQNKKNISVY